MKRLKISLLFTFVFYLLSSQNIDIRILRSLNSPETLSSDRFFQFASNSTTFFILGVPTALATVGFLKNDEDLLRNACVLIAATGINGAITTITKYAINRNRPFITYPDISKKSRAASPSFPSGHTSSSFATATSLSLAYPKWYIVLPSYAWAGTVAYSRMDLGVHYPSDVLAGAIIGAGSAYLTYKINQKLINRKNK